MTLSAPFVTPAYGTLDDRRVALVRWIEEARPNYALTLNPNRELTVEALKRMIRGLLKCMDERHLGKRRANRVATEDRLWAAFAIEHRLSNIHAHLAIRFETHQMTHGGFEGWRDYIDGRWFQITKGAGTTVLVPCFDTVGWAAYITKEYRHGVDDIGLAADFHPDERLSAKGFKSLELC